MKTPRRASRQVEKCCRAMRSALLEDLALGRRLLANARLQQEALLANDFRQLETVEANGRQIAAQQEAAGIRRVAALRALAESCGIALGEEDPVPTLSDLALSLPLGEAKGLMAVRASILELELAIQDAAERNRTLIRSALDVVNFTFQLVAEAATRHAHYGLIPHGSQVGPIYLDHHA